MDYGRQVDFTRQAQQMTNVAACGPVTKESPLALRLGEARKAVEQLEQNIGSLVERLSVLIPPQPPTEGENKCGSPTPMMSSLVSEVASLAGRIDSAGTTIRTLIGVLEL